MKINHPLRMLLVITLAVFMFAFTIGCNVTNDGDDDDDDDDDGGDDDDDDGGDSIYDIQQGQIPEDSVVTLLGVIATSQLFNYEDDYGIFVQEPEGGQYSGIYLFFYSDIAEVVAEVEPGDVINVTGEYVEYYGMSEISVKNPEDIEITGHDDPPTPETVNPQDVATGGDLAEAYESVLIKVEDLEVTNPDLGHHDFEVNSSLWVDAMFYDISQDVVLGDTFDFIVGPLMYSWDNFKIEPRSEDDLGGWGGGGANAKDATIYEIQQEDGVSDGDWVNVKGVTVSSPMSDTPPGFFVQEDGGGQYSGIFIYLKGSSKALTVDVGDLVDITGCKIKEYYGLTELECDEDAIEVTGSGTAPTPELVNAADIATGGSLGEAYEGVLVKVENVTVTSENDDHGQFTVTGGLMIDDLFYLELVSVDDEFASITGPLTYTYENFKVVPRDANDLVAAK